MRLELGLTTAVVVSSRDAAAEAFTRHDRRLAARAVPDATRALGFHERSMVWLPSSDPRWKNLRGVVAAHAFSPRSLEAARGVRERKVGDLVGYLRGRAGEEVDFGRAVYGGVLKPRVQRRLLRRRRRSRRRRVGAGAAGGSPSPTSPTFSLSSGRLTCKDVGAMPLARSRKFCGCWTASSTAGWTRPRPRAKATRPHRTKHGDFLDALLELVSTGKITREDVTAVVFDMLVAGSDTIALTVEWAMAELLRSPSTMAMARAEIKATIGESIEETDTARLPYLHAVVKEAMRLHPVAPLLLPHRCAEDGVEVGGYAVPRGCTVLFNSWAIMRDPAAWERPDEFRPERFLDEAAIGVDFRGKDCFEFLPFGSGRRVCPGVPMAERVLPLVLASLLHAFEWRLPDGVSSKQLDVSEKFTTANVMAVPLKAVPVVVIS